MQTLTEQLQLRLREAGIDPTCRAAGVPPTTVFRWLRGAGGIRLDQAEALAECLGLGVALTPPTPISMTKAIDRLRAMDGGRRPSSKMRVVGTFRANTGESS